MILIFRLKVIYIIWIYQSATSNNLRYPSMIYVPLMNLINAIPDELLINDESFTQTICL